MKITVGKREQIASATLLVPAGEDAWIEFTAGTWDVRLHVLFVDNPEIKNPGFVLTAKDDHAVLTFNNWNSALPSAIAQPFELGQTNGRTVSFMLTGYAVERFKRLDFSFFWEASHGN
ncbi:MULTISPECIES: DUF6864 domain-containing function [unclassified Candidatus Accumulibacter]|uniref:DUF6864 domain-containing function n=1 Tax=unclassified Candidatus Accumulibacter TaxID=2619054 RepID=UPI0005BB06A2|nr:MULTISPECIES: hypothetical protein [unclassified Candidatus Accumulibacter]MBN8513531.1 hypothetical protein [Accumulibacter sp.]MBO3701795.1 hypothetical protein [Accumulibacter sp.]HRE72600.1 hypothetical protein [Accumulibacter sp.]